MKDETSTPITISHVAPQSVKSVRWQNKEKEKEKESFSNTKKKGERNKH